MASRDEHIALEAVRHFREGQLSAWMGDATTADREFRKCQKAITLIGDNGRIKAHELEALYRLSKVEPRKKEDRMPAAQVRKAETGNRIFQMIYTFVPQGSVNAEFRARVNLRRKLLISITRRIAETTDTARFIDDNTFQWIEADRERRFTGLFLITYSDRLIYAQITTHDEILAETVDHLRESVAEFLMQKLVWEPML